MKKCGCLSSNPKEMKKAKYILLPAISCAVLIFAASCYKEDNIIDGILDSKGKVAQISAFWAGNTRPAGSLAAGVTATPLASVNCTIEYITEVAVKEFRLYVAPTPVDKKTLLATVAFLNSKAKFDNDLRNYVVVIPVTAPAAKTATVVFAEVVTTNELSSVQKQVTITAK